MTDIEAKAVALLNDVRVEMGRHTSGIDRDYPSHEALCRAIEQHQAYKQKVSDAVQSWVDGGIDRPAYLWFREKLEQFIIPKPKPDPLEEVLMEIDHAAMWVDKCAEEIRTALGERGWEIREKESK
jgi:hypothetical protein